MLRLISLRRRRFLALFPCEYFYFAVIDGQHLTVGLIAKLAKLGLRRKHIWLRGAECLNAELSGALPTIKYKDSN